MPEDDLAVIARVDVVARDSEGSGCVMRRPRRSLESCRGKGTIAGGPPILRTGMPAYTVCASSDGELRHEAQRTNLRAVSSGHADADDTVRDQW